MIPDEHTIVDLWNAYDLPLSKRNHSKLVARVALFFATRVSDAISVSIDTALLYAGAMLHDIDKNIKKAKDEHHPDTGVRVLCEKGFGEVADLIKMHSLPSILNQTMALKTWEEKILFLSDKMVKHEIITVDERFRLWRKEDLPQDTVIMLDAAFPLVKKLEKEVVDIIGITAKDVANLA